MPRPICHCEKCGASSADVLVDLYGENDDGTGGALVCDPCIEREARADDLRYGRQCVAMPARPEGYYHSPVGAFD